MIIGRFVYDAAADHFKGDVVCLNFQLEGVEMTPNDGLSERQPDYTVTAPAGQGNVEIGSAWKRISERGSPYLSVSLDAPLFAQPLHAALFMNAEGKEAVLIWTRPRPRTHPALVA